MTAGKRQGRRVIPLLFALSGATGLIYEVVWVRQLSLLFGVSIYAVSAVLVAFMGGLGLGAALFGRLIDRGYAPLRLYAVMELCIGLYLFSFTPLLAILESVYLALHGGVAGGALVAVQSIRFVLAVSILLIPTIMMGGTLPAVIRYFSDSDSSASVTSGSLYGLNTFGALIGCVLAGFYLIEAHGLTTTLHIGATVNIILAAIAWGVAAEPEWSTPQGKDDVMAPTGEPFKTDTLVLALFGLSGFCALALEVLWTRLLVLTLNNTTYAFTMILAIFLAGLALGSGLVSFWIRGRTFRADYFFAFFLMGVGLLGGLSLYGFGWYQEAMTILGGTLGAANGVDLFSPVFLYACLILIPSTFVMGGCFPLAVAAFSTRSETIAGLIGRLYAVNTAGSVAGSIMAGYFLVPLLGVEGAILVVAWLALLGGSVMLLVRAGPVWMVVPAALFLLPGTLSALGSEAGLAQRLTTGKLDRGSVVLFFEEGPSATVLVSQTPYDLGVNRQPVDRLWINGDPIAGGYREALMLERLLAHLPLLLHPDAENGLVICFGTGSTAGAALTHGLKQVTAVDVSPEVFAAASYFSVGNQSVMQNKKLRRVVEDGRNFLLTTAERFDFISAEPPPPSNAGVVSLYTVEFYRLAKKRLETGGIFSQWIPLHHLSTTDFKSLMASFAAVFPKGQIWYTKWDAILIGAEEPVVIDPVRIAQGMKKSDVAASLAGIGVTTPDQLIAHHFMGPTELAAYVENVAPVYDDIPTVEFSAPRVLAAGVAVKGTNLKSMMAYRSMPAVVYDSAIKKEAVQRRFQSQGHYLEGKLHENDNRMGEAARAYQRGLDLSPDNSAARYALLRLNIRTLYSVLGRGEGSLAEALLADTRLLDTENLFELQLHFIAGMIAAERGEYLTAEKELLRAVKQDENWLVAMLNLAGLYRQALNQPGRARYYYQKSLTLSLSGEERNSIEKALAALPEADG